MDSKICRRCNESKFETEYYYEKRRNRLHSWCKPCVLEYNQNFTYDREAAYRRKIEVSFGEVGLALLSTKECEICGDSEKLTIDHDHATGKPRGRICSSCNFGLGKFKDDPELLRFAADYLERNP